MHTEDPLPAWDATRVANQSAPFSIFAYFIGSAGSGRAVPPLSLSHPTIFRMLKQSQLESLVSSTGLEEIEILECYQLFQLLINDESKEQLTKDSFLATVKDRNIETFSAPIASLVWDHVSPASTELSFETFVQSKQKVTKSPIELLFQPPKTQWSKDEFATFVRLAQPETPQAQLEWMFARMDKDQTGSITKEQLITTLGLPA